MKKKVNFRKFETSSGKLVLAGKSAENNEELVKEYIGKNNTILHTAKPGSPFCVIVGRANKEDRKEAAIFCARYSQAWRDNKSDVVVHWFKGDNVHKEKGMKLGTFGVKNAKEIKVKKSEIEKWQA